MYIWSNRATIKVFLRSMIVILFSIALVHVQENQPKLKEMQKKLQFIHEEILKLEKDFKLAENKFKFEIHSIENIDRQITLINKKIRIYFLETNSKKETISQLENQIGLLREKIKKLQKIYKQQILFAYKYKRGKHVDWLLGASSFNQALVRYRYFQKVSAAEKSNYDELQRTRGELNTKVECMGEEINVLNNLIKTAKKEEHNLQEKRRTKSGLVKRINQNKELLERSLKEKRKGYKRLSGLIANLEKGRPTRQLKAKTQIKWENLSGNFSKSRGKLNWPVTGKILHKFGRYKNPKLKTVLNNTGIDVRALRGSEVHCIFSGVVSLITYMSGFGNTVIIDHNDGYYTVYSHLDQILVNPGEFLEGGAILGTVGETGSLEGAKLHFEIYGNNKPLNPSKWLKRKNI